MEKRIKERDNSISKKTEISVSTAKKTTIVSKIPYILIGVVISIITISIAGVVMFIETLPGVTVDKFDSLGKSMARALSVWFNRDSSYQVDDNIIYKTVDYIDNMGYDIKNYGFLTDYKTEADVGENQYLDVNSNVIRDDSSNEIVKAESDFLMAYLISDNYIYTFANENSNIGFDDDIIEWFIDKNSIIGSHFANFFCGDYGPHWTSGFLTLWNEGDAIGHRGSYYSEDGLINLDNARFDPDANILHIENGFGIINSNYKLEGWTGRYGMPIELLLSIHLSTLMPDLAYEIAESFNTKLNIILHPYEGEYVPYIENVINHWYRNIYFTNTSYDENNEQDGKTLSFIGYNHDYEEVMKEKWTLYETDDKGNILLYVLSDKANGEFARDASDIDEYKTTKIIQKDGYYIYNGTKKDAEVEKVSVAKKEATESTNNTDYLEELKWYEHDEVWSAYEEIRGDLIQYGDAQRGETNPKIKKIFLENTYFRYDGSAETAAIITALRKEFDIGYGALNEKFDVDSGVLADKKINYKTEDGSRKMYSIQDVAGKVSLVQDSLNTFTMLENTHTLDADYIYRDFKELVVELGYFEKEELTDETPRVLGWVVPDIGSKNYPQRGIDKLENEFGTTIHSKGDIDAYKQATFWSNSTVNGERVEGDGYVYKDIANAVQSVSGRKRKLLGKGSNGFPAVSNDFLASGFDDVDSIIRDWGLKFNLMSAPNYYEQYNEEEYTEWLKTLGGVYSEYAGPNTRGDGSLKAFLDAEKYVYGLMWIAGFEYCCWTCYLPYEGPGDAAGHQRCDPLMDAWYEAGEVPPGNNLWDDVVDYEYNEETGEMEPQPPNPYDAFYGSPGVGHSHVDYLPEPYTREGEYGFYTNIDEAMIHYNFLYECGTTARRVYDKAGLLGDGSDERPTNLNCAELIKKYGAKVITEPQDLSLGDVLIYFHEENVGSDPDTWPEESAHGCFVGEETEDTITIFATGGDFCATGDFRRIYPKSSTKEDVCIAGKSWLGIHLWDLESSDNKYKGYKGNEDVVSPVTGVLLDYGTYSELDDERINVDLKYENYLADLKAQGESLEYAIPRQEYLDKVGYAKIMVLDAYNYKKLESSVDNRWKNNSLLEVGKNGIHFRDDLNSEEELASWSEIDETIYAYKEFAKTYEESGIAGNIIYIDGFECETRDPVYNESSDGIPNGTPIDKSFFDVPEEKIGSEVEKQRNKYRSKDRLNTSNKTEEDKYDADAQVKEVASPSIGTNGMIFIKEGAVMGRTITDRELIEKKRKNELGTYDELRKNDLKDIKNYRVIGNYIRMMMRDSNTDTIVENIEDYIVLDERTKEDYGTER